MPNTPSLNEYDNKNPFAKILRGEEPAKVVYEDDRVIAFLDKYPRAKVHVLVVPKGQYTCFQDFVAKADKEDMSHFCKIVRHVATEICGLEKSGYRIIMNNGKHSEFTIPHLHLHILGGNYLGPLLNNGNRVYSEANQDITVISNRCQNIQTNSEKPDNPQRTNPQPAVIQTKTQSATTQTQPAVIQTKTQSATTQTQPMKVKVGLLTGCLMAINSMWNKCAGFKLLSILTFIVFLAFSPIIGIAALCGATKEAEINPEQIKTCGSQERSHSNLENAKSEPMQRTNVAKQQDVS